MIQITAFCVYVYQCLVFVKLGAALKLQRFVFGAQFVRPSLRKVSCVLFLCLCHIFHFPSARAVFSCLEVLVKDSFQHRASVQGSGGAKNKEIRKCER